jgi:hypothetical protein
MNQHPKRPRAAVSMHLSMRATSSAARADRILVSLVRVNRRSQSVLVKVAQERAQNLSRRRLSRAAVAAVQRANPRLRTSRSFRPSPALVRVAKVVQVRAAQVLSAAKVVLVA